MRNTFKISTFVLKLAVFAFIMSSFALLSARVQAKSPNDRMIDQHVRLSLWYVGVDSDKKIQPEMAKNNPPEELVRAMARLKKDHKDQ